MVDAIILAGGEGKRLKQVVRDVPKPLAVVDGKPFLDVLLDQLNESGCINRVVLAVGYKAEKIIAEYKYCSRFNFEIVFSIEDNLLGTGGGIKKALGLTDTEAVLAMNGDSYAQVDIAGLMKAHNDNKAKLTIVLVKSEDAGRYGIVTVDAAGRINCFEEKSGHGRAGLINAGVYLFDRHIFDDVPQNKVLSIEKELFPRFLQTFKGYVYGYAVNGKFIDIGVPETYKIAHSYLAGKNV